ncbi:MAG: GGDEF domain-containing protein, partial [Nanoarchaeota archaeon]
SAVFAVMFTEVIISFIVFGQSINNLLILRLFSISFYVFLIIFIKKNEDRMNLITNILFGFYIIESIIFSFLGYGDYLIVWLISSQLVFGAFSTNKNLMKILTGYFFALYMGISIYTGNMNVFLHRFVYLTFILVINYYFYLGIERYFSQHEVINDMEEALEDLKNNSSHSLKDALTNTYNRKSLYSILKKEIALVRQHGIISSLVFIDLDNFKQINDKYGHQEGDKILKKISTIFLNIIREEDYICRFGGDEFIFILSDCKKDNAVEIINRIKQKLDEHLQNKKIKLSFSYGIKEINPDEELNSQEIIERADNLMYQNKKNGKQEIFEKA